MGKPILQQFFYIAAGAGLYLSLSWLSFNFFQPASHNITLRPAAVIPVLFGVLYGPWVGLFTGMLGKAISDLVADWGLYWFGSVSYGLIGFFPGLLMVLLKEWKPTRYLSKAILSGVIGVFAGALFLYVTEAYVSEVSLREAIPSYFLPELAGNLIVVIILLPLLLLVSAALHWKGNP